MSLNGWNTPRATKKETEELIACLSDIKSYHWFKIEEVKQKYVYGIMSYDKKSEKRKIRILKKEAEQFDIDVNSNQWQKLNKKCCIDRLSDWY